MEENVKVYGVFELTRIIKGAVESSVGELWLEGEISNIKTPSSGHSYFLIKDDRAQIAAVLFAGDRKNVKLQIKEGMLVRVFGRLTVYEKNGNYQIIVRKIEESGKGDAYAKLEELKKKLKAEGLFDAERKKPLPLLPRHIGIVTSPTGAAIRDILNILERRFPNIHVVLSPTKVQGDGAGKEIADAVNLLNEMGGLDIMIVTRGGGSAEDLWCFNDETAARAIAASRIPVISAVGHEIDFTLSDFAADLRAPTPSAAAELVVGCKETLESKVTDSARRLTRGVLEHIRNWKHRVTLAERSHVFREPLNMIRQCEQRIDNIEMRMTHGLSDALNAGKERIKNAGTLLGYQAKMFCENLRQDLKRLDLQIKAFNPLAVLQRGYSITHDEKGGILRDTAGLSKGKKVQTRLARGSFTSEVLDVDKNKKNGSSGTD